MKVQDVVREAMAINNMNQQALAEKAGYKRQTNVSELLRAKSMRVDNLVRLLDAMECDVVVVSRKEHGISGSDGTYIPRWVITEGDVVTPTPGPDGSDQP